MPKKMFLSILAVVLLTGCTATQGVKVRGYIDDKKRVDQELTSGNAGYIFGQADELPEDRKETRKIFVLEVTKELEEELEEPYQAPVQTSVPTYTRRSTKKQQRRVVAPEPEFVIPSFDDDELLMDEEFEVKKEKPARRVVESEKTGPKTFAVYTVQKNDTLQKISKRFYDSFSKWPKIYEANRLKIKNPDALVVGTVLKIPVQ